MPDRPASLMLHRWLLKLCPATFRDHYAELLEREFFACRANMADQPASLIPHRWLLRLYPATFRDHYAELLERELHA